MFVFPPFSLCAVCGLSKVFRNGTFPDIDELEKITFLANYVTALINLIQICHISLECLIAFNECKYLMQLAKLRSFLLKGERQGLQNVPEHVRKLK